MVVPRGVGFVYPQYWFAFGVSSGLSRPAFDGPRSASGRSARAAVSFVQVVARRLVVVWVIGVWCWFFGERCLFLGLAHRVGRPSRN